MTLSDDELWSAIADPSRRRVLDLLVRRDEATRAMGELAEEWDRRLATIKRLAEPAHRNANDPDARE